jgi:predicted type IV restriction endonuclease
MAPPEHIYELVERFDRNLDAYRSGKYNEAQVRQEFINPFFENLGWDIYNKEGYSETKEPQAKTVLQRQIETTDRQIDRLVYEL